MPQMAPLSWINLFISFIIMFLIMSSLNFFSFSYKSYSDKTDKKTSYLNWKW